MSTEELSSAIARRIIETVGGHGTPPEWGFQFFTSGLDEYLQVIDEDYLKSYLPDGGAAFKMVIGAYGGGKTHFLYNVREMAWSRGFVVSYVTLKHDESPFHRMERVYRAIVSNLMYPMSPEELLEGSEKGIAAFIKVWYQRVREKLGDMEDEDPVAFGETLEQAARSATMDVENTNFARAIRAAFRALSEYSEDEFETVVQWLKVEGFDAHRHRQFGILRPIDRSNAFSAIRSLVRWVRNLDYSGLVILLDEAEQVPSLSSKQQEMMLSNLRELIDECGHASFRNVMIFYAVPNENFLEGKSHVYEALKQRVATVFDFFNPGGVKIYLEELIEDPVSLLADIGTKLAMVFQTAYGVTMDPQKVHELVDLVARESYEQRFGDIGYKRLFVQGVIRGFQYLRRRPEDPIDESMIHRLFGDGG
jgi:hypothetical protein